MMFAPRANDVAFGSDVHYVNDVTPNGVVANIASLRGLASNIIMRSITSLLRQQKHH